MYLMTVATADLRQRVIQEHRLPLPQSTGTFKLQHLPLLQTHLPKLDW